MKRVRKKARVRVPLGLKSARSIENRELNGTTEVVP